MSSSLNKSRFWLPCHQEPFLASSTCDSSFYDKALPFFRVSASPRLFAPLFSRDLLIMLKENRSHYSRVAMSSRLNRSSFRLLHRDSSLMTRRSPYIVQGLCQSPILMLSLFTRLSKGPSRYIRSITR